MKSPCIKVCVINPEWTICEGCGRTAEEIAQWIELTEAEQEEIINTLEDRLIKCGLL